jgi:hypothetical protein
MDLKKIRLYEVSSKVSPFIWKIFIRKFRIEKKFTIKRKQNLKGANLSLSSNSLQKMSAI